MGTYQGASLFLCIFFDLHFQICVQFWSAVQFVGLLFVHYNTLTPFKEYAVFLGCSTWKSSTTGVSELIPGAW